MNSSSWKILVFAAEKITMSTETLLLTALMAPRSRTNTGTPRPAPVWTSVNSLKPQ
jgi:hypothetical protein